MPGKFVVLARKGAGHWYIAGINGESASRELHLSLGDFLPADGRGALITDGRGGNLSFDSNSVRLSSGRVRVTLQPHGGFVLVFGS